MLYNKLKQAGYSRVVKETAATVQVRAAVHANQTIALARAAGQAVTLPKATGSGAKYKFVVTTAITSNSTTIKVPDADTTFIGNAVAFQDGGDTMVGFEAGATADTVTLDGTTLGGLAGHLVEVEDVDTNVFFVRSMGAATGSEATPFSATVS